MKSAPSNYSEYKFSAKSDNFKKITLMGGFFTFWGLKMPSRGRTIIFSKEKIMVVSIPKIRKFYSGVGKI